MGKYDYDLIVIGGGIAGFAASVTASGLGKKVALIENRKLGGNCTSFTCIPSKALIRAAHTNRQFARASQYGLSLDGARAPDTAGVMAHVRTVVQKAYEKDSPDTFERVGIRVLFGSPEFVDRHHVTLDGHVISARGFILATGTRPLIPPIPGLDGIEFLTNETVFELDKLPRSLIVLGGGVDGLEYASAFGRLGVEVSLVEMAPQLLPTVERELVDLLVKSLSDDGIRVMPGTKAVRFSGKGKRKVLEVEGATSGEMSIEAEAVLVTIGRKANVEGLALEKAGVAFGPRGITADARLRTSAANIYACGDVVGPYQLASTAEYQGITAATNATLPFKRKVDYRDAVFVIFTEPTLAYTGLTEEQARRKYGPDARVFRFDYATMRRAMVDGGEPGLAKVICRSNGQVIGAHILGEAAAEVIHEVQAVKALRRPLDRLYVATHAYPTYAQAIVGRASQLAFLEKKERNPFVRLFLRMAPGFDNRLAMARMRLAEATGVDGIEEVPEMVGVSVTAHALRQQETHVEAARVSSGACIVRLPRHLTDDDETAVLVACGVTSPEEIRHIVLDFGAVERMNGLGASMLVKLCARARRRRQRVLAYGVGEHYRNVLRLTGLDRALALYESPAQALLASGVKTGAPDGFETQSPAEPRDASFWAEAVARLRVPDMPAEAVSQNVSGRRPVGPVEGFGPLWQKAYRQRLPGAGVTTGDVIAALKQHFPSFQPPENRFYPSAAGIEPGEIVLINASTPGGPVYTGVMVLYADEDSFTFITPQGHPESGWVSFSAFDDGGTTVAQIMGLARAGDPVYEVAFRLAGSKVQEDIWRHVLSSLATHFGVAPAVNVRKTLVDPGVRWSAAGNVRYNAQMRSMPRALFLRVSGRRAAG